MGLASKEKSPPDADKYPKEDLIPCEFPRNSALAAPSASHLNPSLSVGPLVEARGRFSGGSRQNYEGTPEAAKRRESHGRWLAAYLRGK